MNNMQDRCGEMMKWWRRLLCEEFPDLVSISRMNFQVYHMTLALWVFVNPAFMLQFWSSHCMYVLFWCRYRIDNLYGESIASWFVYLHMCHICMLAQVRRLEPLQMRVEWHYRQSKSLVPECSMCGDTAKCISSPIVLLSDQGHPVH